MDVNKGVKIMWLCGDMYIMLYIKVLMFLSKWYVFYFDFNIIICGFCFLCVVGSKGVFELLIMGDFLEVLVVCKLLLI